MATRYACGVFLTEAERAAFIKCDCELAGLPIDEIADQVADAIAILTFGAVRGRCTITVRPCADRCVCGSDWADACNCCRRDGIPLPGVDVEVTSIRVDGAPLLDNEWHIVDSGHGPTLVRTEGTWPACQTLSLPATEPRTFEVVYEEGFLPLFAKLAAAELECELATEIAVARGGRPPSNWTSANLDGLVVSRDRYAKDPQAAVDQFEALGLQWTAKLLNLYAGGAEGPDPVWSVETGSQWTLFTVTSGASGS